MRIRIALATAVAVIVVIPALLFALFSQQSGRLGAGFRHQAVSQHRAATSRLEVDVVRPGPDRSPSWRTTTTPCTVAEQETYLKEVAISRRCSPAGATKRGAAAQLRAAAAAAAAAPAHRARARTPHQQPRRQPRSRPRPTGGSDATSTNTADWACIREHESGDNYAEGGGGAYQFELGTWEGLTGLPTPAEDSPPAVQDAAALKLYAQRGWEPWTTRYVCGL